MIKRILLLFFAINYVSCSNSNLYSFYSNGLLSDYPNKKGYNYYIIIPHAGCPGCTTNAENLLIQNKDSKNYFFIITNYTSKKALFLKLGKRIEDYQNVVLDSANNYYAQSFKECIYPQSLELNKNKIIKITFGIP